MKLSSLIDDRLIKCPLAAGTRDEAVAELVDLLVAERELADRDALYAALIERERQSSTALGMGAAFPHTRSTAVNDFHIAIGTSPEGIDFGAPDGKPVRLVVLMVVAQAASNVYLQTLAAWSRLVQQRDVFERIAGAGDAEELWEAVESTGIEVEKTIRARDIMTTDYPRAALDTSIKEVLDVVSARHLPEVPVVDARGDFAGRISIRDVLRLGIPAYVTMMSDVSFLADYEPFEDLLQHEEAMTAEDVTNEDALVFQADTPIIQVAHRMLERHAATAYVLEGRKLAGVITLEDFVTKVLRA